MWNTKQCADCGNDKLPEEFNANRATSDGLHYYCKACMKVRSKDYARRNHELIKERRRVCHKVNYVRRVYGISLEEYDAILVRQKNRCPICLKVIKKPSIDHCHATGKIRGILCRHCNSSLSVFENDPTALERLAAYLATSPRKNTGKTRGR